jgi:hypothetical protein
MNPDYSLRKRTKIRGTLTKVIPRIREGSKLRGQPDGSSPPAFVIPDFTSGALMNCRGISEQLINRDHVAGPEKVTASCKKPPAPRIARFLPLVDV